jgi:hypothetical protein
MFFNKGESPMNRTTTNQSKQASKQASKQFFLSAKKNFYSF